MERSDADAEYLVRNFVEPLIAAEHLREEGVRVHTELVVTNPDAEGFTVTCVGCGRTGKVSFDPGGQVGFCPICVSKMDLE